MESLAAIAIRSIMKSKLAPFAFALALTVPVDSFWSITVYDAQGYPSNSRWNLAVPRSAAAMIYFQEKATHQEFMRSNEASA